MYEHFFQCPYCWEEISMLIDASIEKQTYVEDCEVCCNLIEISTTFVSGEISAFEVNEIGQ